jgi:hypothetical protein
MKPLLIFVCLLSACSIDGTVETKSQKASPEFKKHDSVPREWRRHPKDGVEGEQWDLVCPVTGRLDGAQITFDKDEQVWKVWSQGGGYGDFATKEQSVKQAERVLALRVGVDQIEACPPDSPPK